MGRIVQSIAKAANTNASHLQAPSSQGKMPVALRVHGADMLLSGHFHRWQTIVARGPDLDVLQVKIAVDATSPADLIKGALPAGEAELFSFKSTKVTKVADRVYMARGRLKASGGSAPTDVLIEVPEGHTAFFALTFAAPRSVLGERTWDGLMDASGQVTIDDERRADPRSGVRELEVAAA